MSQQAPKAQGKAQNVIHKEVCYTPKEQLEFSSVYRQIPAEHVWA